MSISRDGNAEACCSRTQSSSISHHPKSTLSPRTSPLSISSMHREHPENHSTINYHPKLRSTSSSIYKHHQKYFIHSISESTIQKSSILGIPINIPTHLHSMTAGAGAGLVSSIVTCPLDVIKTRLQAQLASKDAGYEGVSATIKRIWKQSGLRGFYRGLGPTLGGYLPTWGIYFTVYDLVKDRLGEMARSGAHPHADTTFLHIFAAMTAGATGTVMTNPLWVVKTRFMAQAVLPPSAARYRNTFEAVTSIYRTEGFRAFYKGLLPSLLGVSHVAIQFPIYEAAKAWADPNGNHSSLPPTTILSCSAFSKMIASLATYPHEVLRTRLQIAKSASTKSNCKQSIPSIINNVKIPPIPSTAPTELYSPLVTGSMPPLPLSEPVSNNRIHGPTPNGLDRARSMVERWTPKKGGIIDTAIKIKRQDGWRGFYRGLSINLVRTVPNSAVTMLTYELIMRRLALASSESASSSSSSST